MGPLLGKENFDLASIEQLARLLPAKFSSEARGQRARGEAARLGGSALWLRGRLGGSALWLGAMRGGQRLEARGQCTLGGLGGSALWLSEREARGQCTWGEAWGSAPWLGAMRGRTPAWSVPGCCWEGAEARGEGPGQRLGGRAEPRDGIGD